MDRFDQGVHIFRKGMYQRIFWFDKTPMHTQKKTSIAFTNLTRPRARSPRPYSLVSVTAIDILHHCATKGPYYYLESHHFFF
jgi:hypothetical protein